MGGSADNSATAERPPYRPFRFLARVAVSLLAAVVIWAPLSVLSHGLDIGPGESVSFDSLAEAERRALSGEGGLAWPGSSVEAREVESGFVVERKWLGISEVRLPLDRDLRTDTARLERGPGEVAQQIVIVVVALGMGTLVFLGAKSPRHGFVQALGG